MHLLLSSPLKKKTEPKKVNYNLKPPNRWLSVCQNPPKTRINAKSTEKETHTVRNNEEESAPVE
jgi:hypothetical protein